MRFLLAWVILALSVSAANAQTTSRPCYAADGNGSQPCTYVSPTTPMPVTGTFSASVAGFPTTQTTGTPISVTTGGVSGTLPAGAVVVATNVGTTNAAYCKLGASATTSDQYIAPSGGWFAFTVGSATQLTCITSTSTTTVNMVGGSGLPTGTGGGSGGGGGGGAVFGPTAGGSAAANPPVLMGGTVDGTTTGNVDNVKVASGLLWTQTSLNAETTKVIGEVNQGTSPWVVSNGGTFATQSAITAASGSIASGAIASGAVASGAFVSGSIADGAEVTIGAKADAKNAATDTTAITIMQVLKEISSLEQAPASRAVTNAGTFAVQATLQASGSTAIGKVDPNTIATWGLAAASQNVAAPTNGWLGLCQFTTSPTTISTTNVSPIQCDNANNVLVKVSNTNANGQAIAANSSPVVAPVLTVAGAAVVKGGVPVVNGGSNYLAVAASQTATVLQTSTGATGDYLSHCVIYPASTSPGVVTVFDSTNTAANSAILFAGGASSTSNLTPIPVPVGAVSVNGAWKVTTGANVSVVCYGKFS